MTATHCNTLQPTATHCNALNDAATHRATLHHTAPQCTTRHHIATRCTTLHHTTLYCNILQCSASGGADEPGANVGKTHCNTPQQTAPHCTTLYHTAAHWCTLQDTVWCGAGDAGADAWPAGTSKGAAAGCSQPKVGWYSTSTADTQSRRWRSALASCFVSAAHTSALSGFLCTASIRALRSIHIYLFLYIYTHTPWVTLTDCVYIGCGMRHVAHVCEAPHI